MIFPGSARAALGNQRCFRWTAVAVSVLLAGLSISCFGPSSSASSATHNAYITLPQTGSVQLLRINNSSGVITAGAQTPPVQGATPRGLALHPSKKFLFVANSAANTISVFNIAGDGTLTLSGNPTPAGPGPRAVVIDPSGQFLLVTNSLANPFGTISVYSINSGTGALSEVAGSPFSAKSLATEMVITPSGKFVYVTDPAGYISAFSFSSGVLSEVAGSPFAADRGVSDLTVDSSEKFLYTTNTTANNVSGFQINSSGALTPVQGSPYSTVAGSGPSAIAIDPANTILYVTTPGSSFSIWAFTIDATTGVLTTVKNSPFNLLTGGGLFLLMDPTGSYFYVGSQSTSSGAGNIAGYTYDSGTGVPTAMTGSPFSTGSTPGKMVISH
jgi:6-phosphogluconolactonase